MYKLLLFIFLNISFVCNSSDVNLYYLMFKDENSEYDEDNENNAQEESNKDEDS